MRKNLETKSAETRTAAFIRTSNIYDDSRATKEILALLENGWNVIVLGWNRSGDAPEKCARIFGKFSDSVEIHLYSVEMRKGIGMKNILKLFGWFKWVKKILRKCPDIDVVHICNLDAGLGAFSYAKKHCKIVYDIYDYYIDSHTIPRFLVNFVERLEIKMINASSATIICTEERREQIVKASPKQIVVIHNTPEVEYISSGEMKYDYVYCGTLRDKRLIAEILEAYESNSDLKFIFAGYGKFEDRAEELASKYENFDFPGSVPYSDVLNLESESRIISAIYEPTIRNHRLCAPNKFYEAMALGKPVIVCRGTGIDRIVEKYHIGLVIGYDVNEFYDALRTLKSDPDLCANMGKTARKLYEDVFNWSLMKERLVRMYEEISM